MKFFSRVETKIKETRLSGGAVRRSRFRSTFVVALAALACVGCVGRKQYAINEAILVSERRQLEDEIYRLQFELRDALEENERLRQELSGDAAPNVSNGVKARAGANDAFYPGLDASQTRLRTTGGAKNSATTSANVWPSESAPQNAESAPATGDAVETLPDYVPIPVTSTQRANAQVARSAPNVGKVPGLRRVVPVAASNENDGEVVASVFVDAPPTKEREATTRSANAAAWSPLAQ